MSLQEKLNALDPADPQYATDFVDALLAAARAVNASDVHLQPAEAGIEIRWRLDGVLQPLGTFPAGSSTHLIARLKVMAELLTYRTDVPQEGRLRDQAEVGEMRVSTFPTLDGERAVVRLFARHQSLQRIEDLGLPGLVAESLEQMLRETSGVVLVTGPAGSGKTTTVYAALREIAANTRGEKSLVSLEDPIEVAVAGVAQSQVKPAAGFDLATGLRSLMRQDPEVILVGEVRDRETAEAVFQAALTGHLVLTTFHAGSAAGAVSRLCDMGIEPYLLRSGVLAIICQRLCRRLCDCAGPGTDQQRLGLDVDVERIRLPVGCERCFSSGYRGRMVLAEMLVPGRDEIGRAILSRSDADQLEQLAIQGGMITRWQRAVEAVESGATSPAEIRRVLGFSR